MGISVKTLGIFSNCIDIIIQEHEPTKTVFELIRQRMITFVELLTEKSTGDGYVAQTGSSFDGLHLSRLLETSAGKYVFYPPIDFDFMMTYVNYTILDNSGEAVGSDVMDFMIQNSKEFAIMVPSLNPGYVKLVITEAGKRMIQKPQCEFEKHITNSGFIPNFVFKAKLFPEQYENVEVLYEREKSRYVSSGPALSDFSRYADGYSYDFVHSFPCETWPMFAVNWIRRPKSTGWPCKDLIEDIVKGIYRMPKIKIDEMNHDINQTNISLFS